MSPNVKIIIITLSFSAFSATHILCSSQLLRNITQSIIPVSYEDNKVLIPFHDFPFFPPFPQCLHHLNGLPLNMLFLNYALKYLYLYTYKSSVSLQNLCSYA